MSAHFPLLRRPRMLASASDSSSHSSMTASVAGGMASDVGSGAAERTNSSGDSCAYYGLEPGETCQRPRTCQDCLNVAVASDPDGCLLSQFGMCESMSFYDPELDYRASGSNADSGSATDFSGGLYHTFPAVNTTYCDADDPACLYCDALARNYSAAGNFVAKTTKFCVGESGCVCVLSCERSVWELRTSKRCASSSSSSESSSGVSSAPVSGTISPTSDTSSGSSAWDQNKQLMWLIVVPLMLGLFYTNYRRFQVIQRQRRGRVVSPTHRLRLSGWRALNEQLMEKEKQPSGSRSKNIDPITRHEEAE